MSGFSGAKTDSADLELPEDVAGFLEDAPGGVKSFFAHIIPRSSERDPLLSKLTDEHINKFSDYGRASDREIYW